MEWAPAQAEPLQACSWRAPTSGRGAGPPADVAPQDAELLELASHALRVLLGSNTMLVHAQLRLAMLGRSDSDGAMGSRMKCLLELAVAWLIEQGLVLRQGYGPFAALLVPDAALAKAEALAYSDFPDEGQLAVHDMGALRPLPAAHRPALCINRLRRHSSPRHFGSRMSGIEKPGARRSAKRSVGDDISSHMAKKLRMQEGGVSTSSPGGDVAMSP